MFTSIFSKWIHQICIQLPVLVRFNGCESGPSSNCSPVSVSAAPSTLLTTDISNFLISRAASNVWGVTSSLKCTSGKKNLIVWICRDDYFVNTEPKITSDVPKQHWSHKGDKAGDDHKPAERDFISWCIQNSWMKLPLPCLEMVGLTDAMNITA